MLASSNEGGTPITSGSIDFKENSDPARTAHIYKWIKYSNKFNNGIIDYNDMFTNYSVISGAGQGYHSGYVNLRYGNNRFKTFIDLFITQNYNGHVYSQIIISGGQQLAGIF